MHSNNKRIIILKELSGDAKEMVMITVLGVNKCARGQGGGQLLIPVNPVPAKPCVTM